MNVLQRLRRDDRGQGMVEYCLVLVFFAIPIIWAFQALNNHTSTVYVRTSDDLTYRQLNRP